MVPRLSPAWLGVGTAVGALAVLLVLIAAQPSPYPADDDCVAFWNSPGNRANQTALVAFRSASLAGWRSEGRGAACSVAAWQPSGEWTIYVAEVETWDERRISRPMWTVSAGGGRWGVDSPEGDILRRPNVTIQVDGRLTSA